MWDRNKMYIFEFELKLYGLFTVGIIIHNLTVLRQVVKNTVATHKNEA